MTEFERGMQMLNDAQRTAVEHLDGPLIVIAGPGTGKTQLLSLRAANILKNRDIQPQNILCLTYTEAGAEAMTKRLIQLIGRDGYGIEVATFHGFASACRSRYPEFFGGASEARVVSQLHAQEMLDKLLKALPFGTPLSGTFGGVASSIGAVSQFISNMKRQGLTPNDYRAIMRQNLAAADYLSGAEEFMAFLTTSIPRAERDKTEFIDAFEVVAARTCALAPAALTQNVIGAGGVYVPYITWLARRLTETPLMEGKSTAGFQNLKKELMCKDASGQLVLSLREDCEKALVAADIYEAYQARLHAEGLHDFDDMIMDFIAAVRDNPALRYALQERYRYIQVDEFQDTNAAQMRIVELLCDGVACPNVMAVGDDDQAIMRFQGASIACIDQFRTRFAPKSVVLKTNYRSIPEVVELGQRIAEQIERRLPESTLGKHIEAFRPSKRTAKEEGAGAAEAASAAAEGTVESAPAPAFAETVFATQELEYQALARDIRRRIDEGFVSRAKNPDEAIAVIASKHDSLRALIPYLKAENVPFTYKQTSDLFSLEPLQTTLATLRCVAAHASGNIALANSFLPQIIASPEFDGNSAASIRFALFAKREHYGNWIAALGATQDKRLSALFADFMDWSTSATGPVRELIFRITARSRRYYTARAQDEPLAFAEYNAGVRALLAFVSAELGTAAALGRTMRLPDVVNRLDRAAAFRVSVDAGVGLSAPGAVRLTSAHSSKGLEFDLVYVLDAEQGVWHGRGAGGVRLYPPNLLIGNERDEDDARRLLFVAVTRAKDELQLYRAGGCTICELAESIGTHEVGAAAADLGSAIETSWRDSYALNTPELRALLAPALPPRSLSATALNEFVAYTEEGFGAATFPQHRVMGLPEPPAIALEYGSAVHAFFEEYVNTVVKARGGEGADVTVTPGMAPVVAEMTERYRKLVASMDFLPEDTERYARQFVRVAQNAAAFITSFAYLPSVAEGSGKTLGEGAATPAPAPLHFATEVKLTAIVGDNVPLYGECDLLLANPATKTIRVVDYKTGFGYPQGEPERAYQRQLQFYRLLIENSAEYAGWRVTSCENWYVEPEKGTDALHAPVASSVSDDDIAYLVRLINAAWHRIERGAFDTSAFDSSAEKAAALADLASRSGKVTKKARLATLQAAYESWLIAQDEGAHGEGV